MLLGDGHPASAAERLRAAATRMAPGRSADRHLGRPPTRLRAAPRAAGSVFTDDVAPVEWLIDASIVDVAADGER